MTGKRFRWDAAAPFFTLSIGSVLAAIWMIFETHEKLPGRSLTVLFTGYVIFPAMVLLVGAKAVQLGIYWGRK